MSNFLRALTATLVLLVALEGALLAQQTPAAPAPLSTGESFFGSLARRFSIYLSDRPFFINERDIDAVVGDPWSLEPSTAAKLRLLPARVRMRLYSVLTLNADAYTMMPAASSDNDGMVIHVDPEASKKMLDGVLGAFTDQFRTEELVDLGVYFLSTTPYFPKTLDGWRALKKGVIMSDFILAAAYLAAVASTDSGKISASGWIVKLPGDRFRLGWYGGLSHLGIAWHPDLRAGAQVSGTLVDVRGGVVHRVGAASDAEVTAIEGEIREHWLQKVLEPLSKWQASMHAGVRYVAEHNDPRRDHSVTLSTDILAKKPTLFGVRELDLLLSARFSSDFNHTTTFESMIGVAHGELGISGAAGMAMTRDDILGNSLRGGLFVEGSFDFDPRRRENELQRLASQINHDLEYLDEIDGEYRDLERGLSLNTGTRRTPETDRSDRQILEQLRNSSISIARGIENLKRHLGLYLPLWQDICLGRGWERARCNKESGSLEPEALARARLWVGANSR